MKKLKRARQRKTEPHRKPASKSFTVDENGFGKVLGRPEIVEGTPQWDQAWAEIDELDSIDSVRAFLKRLGKTSLRASVTENLSTNKGGFRCLPRVADVVEGTPEWDGYWDRRREFLYAAVRETLQPVPPSFDVLD